MQLNISYDANTLATAPSGFFSAVNYVVSLFDATFINNAIVNIEVGYGNFPKDNSAVNPLGESEQNNAVFAGYSQVRQTLVNDGAPGSGTLPLSSPLSGGLVLGSAQEKALGLVGSASSLDGWVGIASDATLMQKIGGSWSFDPAATPSPSQFYIVGVLEHEFSEIMGRVSYLTQPGEYGIVDLYRYAAPGVRQTGAGDPAYFSLDRGNTNLDSWNDAGVAAGDLADWAPRAGPSGVFFHYAGPDAFLNNSPPGQINPLTAADFSLMAALGWSAAPPDIIDRYAFFAPGQIVNLVATPDGSNLPAPLAGRFNLELVTAPLGTSYSLAPGYQGIAILPGGTGFALQMLSGNMTVADTAGGDAITLGAGAQTVIGALGDTITGGSGPDLVNALAGGQSVTGGTGAMTVWGAAGDTIAGGPGSGFIDGTLGFQRISGGGGPYVLLGGAGDTISGGAGPTTIIGAKGDTIAGGSGATLINGLAGSQQITGGTGNMTVWGGAGDKITGGSGGNALDGQPGDTILGGAGGGFIDGSAGAQLINSGSGSAAYTIVGGKGDTIAGGSGADLINGLAGSQQITGGTGAATIWGGAGDTITAGPGTKLIAGQPGDTIAGGSATNLLVNGTLGAQSVSGGSGATTVWAGGGDRISGGAGSLGVAIAHSAFTGPVLVGDIGIKGSSTVTGFSQPAGDRMFFPNETAAAINGVVATAQASNGNTIVTLPDSSTLTLIGVAKIDSSFFV